VHMNRTLDEVNTVIFSFLSFSGTIQSLTIHRLKPHQTDQQLAPPAYHMCGQH
jgi:hypothetical protein